jgi:predicted signal transduction protein with EAL and GGDEF domain
LAHELGIEVIAEGVEMEGQARFLVAAECRYAQGYFFSKPVTADAATALLRQGRIDLFFEGRSASGAASEDSARSYPRLQSVNAL